MKLQILNTTLTRGLASLGD